MFLLGPLQVFRGKMEYCLVQALNSYARDQQIPQTFSTDPVEVTIVEMIPEKVLEGML